ncbi:putative transposase [Phytophthora citrophthora]|uniref:Transposase n=1 Tax=Phytophthora citrophthora TaxID=4793 RepID=A0AAD9GB37_9STRA|nr:putative transposase [Phytophthora citrophthora]
MTEQINLPNLLQELDTCQEENIVMLMSSILAHVLCGHVSEYRPLLKKLPGHRRRLLEAFFDAHTLDTLEPPYNRPDFASWFSFQTQTNSINAPLTLHELEQFPHIQTWQNDAVKHQAKYTAFEDKARRARTISNYKSTINILKVNAEDHASDIESAKHELALLEKEKKRMIRRMRKYRLFPTSEQRKFLRQFMGTCRWTYNQAVAHFRKTNVYRADLLRDLYVTKTTIKEQVYPEDMGPPPEWVFDTPKNFRFNALRRFQSNVRSAFSNKRNGNITKFKIGFKNKKESRFFTICEDAKDARITYVPGQSRALLSISKLKDIPIRCDPGLSIANEIQILNDNGFWYAAIPTFVRPSDNVNLGRAVTLDPGLKAFMTGVDLCGNSIHIGRGTRAQLDKLRGKAADAQRVMSEIKNMHGHRSGKQWKTFARAKRTFDCATAKIKNCVKELHYQTCAYLTKHYDTILLPIFTSKQMVKKSCARNHTFNKMLLDLKHYQFRELLRAKCEVTGKSLVVCSEMYTTQTCGNCSRLHLKIGNKDVFNCPHCDYIAGRDLNAAFNILRFTCAGSLAVHTIHR